MFKSLKFLGVISALALLGVALPALAEGREDGSCKERRGARLERFDADGDGQLSPDERQAGKELRRERRLEFDADGDGRLSGNERSAAREARRARRESGS